MFTGIVEELGRVVDLSPRGGVHRLTVAASSVLDELPIGGSIAVNGVCLTAVTVDSDRLTVEVIQETLRRSNLGDLRVGAAVNLERPLRAGGRLDGHWVQGHVDGVARVLGRRADGRGSERIEIELPVDLARYVVPKGSIAVDGISLTVGEVTARSFAVYLIPHTLQVTTMGRRAVGARLNLEVDILAKYVERLTAGARSALDRDAGSTAAAWLEAGRPRGMSEDA